MEVLCQDDPFDWNIQKVIAEVLQNPSPPWLENSSTSKLNHSLIVSSFEANDVNGEVLLTGIGKNELQKDLGIQSLGQRHLILKAINFLQKQSQKYQERYPQQPSLGAYFSPQTTYSTRSPLQSSTVAYSADSRAESPRSVNDFYEPRAGKPRPPLFTRSPMIETSIEQDQVVLSDSTPNTTVPNEGNFDLDVGIDRTEQKDISEATEYERAKPERSDATPPDQSSSISGKPKKRVAPVRIGAVGSYVNQGAISSQPRIEDRPKTLPTSIEDVFYPVGVNDDTSFFIAGQMPNDIRLFVHKAIRNFLQQPTKQLEGTSMLYRIPYSLRSTMRNSRLFTMFPPGARCMTQDTSDWPALEKTQTFIASGLQVQGQISSVSAGTVITQNDEDDGYFNMLLEKYPANDTNVIDFDNESEDGVSLDEETWAEIQQEVEENKAHHTQCLSPPEVSRIIDDTIAGYIENFRETKLHKIQMKGFKLWSRAAVLGRRKVEKAAIEAQIEHLTGKIRISKSDIAMHPWNKEADLRFQCQSLQEHVNQREEARYFLTVLSSSSAPPRPQVPRVHRHPKIHEDLPEGEEVLESESDVSLDGFIVDDKEETLDVDMADDEMDDTDMQLGPDQAPVDATSPERNDKPKEDEGSLHDRSSGPDLPERGSNTSIHKSSSLTGSERDLSDLDILLPESRYKEIGRDEASAIQLSSDASAPEDSSVAKSPNNDSEEEEDDDDDDDDDPIRLPTRLVDRHRRYTPAKNTSLDLDGLEAIQALEYKDLESRSDRKRLLVKLVVDLQSKDASRLHEYINNLKNQREMAASIRIGVEEILSESRANSPDNEFDDSKEIRTMELLLARLYISYDACKAFLEWTAIPPFTITPLLTRLDALKTFCGILKLALRNVREKGGSKRLIRRTKKPTPDAKAQSETEDSIVTENNQSSDESSGEVASDQDMVSALTGMPHRIRKREVKDSQEALRWQQEDAKRVQEFERRKEAAMVDFDPSENNRPAITFSEPVQIHLDPHIGSRVKPHQVAGVQFMWREIVDNKTQQGCLLAHTMGLGKTMQVIAFLSTLNQAAQSQDPAIRNQVPERLRQSKTLIIAPASLILNWVDEFAIWTPKTARLGRIRHFANSDLRKRIRTLAAWANDGGILISSYEIFRDMILKKQTLTDQQHEDSKLQLLSPSIIVADEAHRMKNLTGRLFEAASLFESKSRIALTGSPLANNLEEYYTMIQWVAPGYLGELVQFKAKFSEPITQGLWSDSTRHQKRTSLRKLHLLKKVLEPKTSRADIGAIAADIPQKTEFFLTVSLSEVQTKAYEMFIDGLLGGDKDVDKLNNTKVFSWLALLALLCNHPATFQRKIEHALETPRSSTSHPSKPDRQEETAKLPFEQRVAYSDIPSEMLQDQFTYLGGITNLSDTIYSAKATLIDNIICQSIAVGDKILLFSHSIGALAYYQKLMDMRNFKYARLDGNTKVALRQSATKRFNSIEDDTMVYLISMRAGGLGLNLPGANRVIIVDFSFNPTWEEQAIGRAYRLGQKKPVFVYRFRTGGTFEEIVYNKSVFKTQLSARVVDDKSWASYATRKAKDYLFKPKEVQQHDLSTSYGKDTKVLDKILSSDGHGIRNIELTETFQREDDEQLTAEELNQVQQELDDENLMRNDPEAYKVRLLERQRADRVNFKKAYHITNRALASGYMSSALWPPQNFGFSIPPHLAGPTGYSSESLLRDAGYSGSFGSSTNQQDRAPSPEPSSAEPHMSTLGAIRPRGSSNPLVVTSAKRPHPSSYDGANNGRAEARHNSLDPILPVAAPVSTSNNLSLQQSDLSPQVKKELTTPIINADAGVVVEVSSDSDVVVWRPSKKQKTTDALVAEQKESSPLRRTQSQSSVSKEVSTQNTSRLKEKMDCVPQ